MNLTKEAAEQLQADPPAVKHIWRPFRHEPDGTYEGMRCQVQTWKCERCQTKMDTPAEQNPENFETTNTCVGLAGLQAQTQPKEKWQAPINGK